MGHQFEAYEIIFKKRGRAWTWRVITAEGKLVMQGSEGSRFSARYIANRALFLLLLSSSYRLKRRDIPVLPKHRVSDPRDRAGFRRVRMIGRYPGAQFGSEAPR